MLESDTKSKFCNWSFRFSFGNCPKLCSIDIFTWNISCSRSSRLHLKHLHPQLIVQWSRCSEHVSETWVSPEHFKEHCLQASRLFPRTCFLDLKCVFPSEAYVLICLDASKPCRTVSTEEGKDLWIKVKGANFKIMKGNSLKYWLD